MSVRASNFWDLPEPAPTAQWERKRQLAKAVRELVNLCVTTDGPEEILAWVKERVEELSTALRQHKGGTFKQAILNKSVPEDARVFADRSPIVGQCNPVAPPMSLRAEGDTSVGEVTFGPPFEGVPGVVHGGFIAAAFDQLFGHLQLLHGKPSMTASLSIRYASPTPLMSPLVFSARIDRIDGRKTFVVGRVMAHGRITAEADGVFLSVDSEKLKEITHSSHGEKA